MAPWHEGDQSMIQPRYNGYWEAEDAYEWGPGWNDLAAAVMWGRARAPVVRLSVAFERPRRALSLGREPIDESDILVEESTSVGAEIRWPDTVVSRYGGEVRIVEASGGWDSTGEYTVSTVVLSDEIDSPEELNNLEADRLSEGPFRFLGDAVEAAGRHSSFVIVRDGPPPGFFFSAGREEPPGLQLPRMPERWL